MPYKSFFNLFLKYSYLLLRIFCYLKMESEIGSLECAQGIQKFLEGEKNIENGFYSNDLESEFKKDS